MAQVNRISTRIVQANAYIQLKELRSNSRLGGLTGDFSNTSAIYQATRLLILSHVVFSACSLEESAICVRSSALEASKRVLFTIASRSSGGVKNPVLPSMTISLGPPASRATTGPARFGDDAGGGGVLSIVERALPVLLIEERGIVLDVGLLGREQRQTFRRVAP